MATNTYVALKTSTVAGSSAPSITLDNIPQGYTDLRIVISAAPASGGMNYLFQVGNGSVDTTSTYSQTFVSGTGSVANSNRTSSATYWQAYINAATTNQSVVTAEIQNYSSGSVYKPVIIRANGSGETTASAGIWRSTSAINIVTVTAQTNNFAIGSSITIYGIAAEGALAKATGGAIYSDSQYWYHAFANSGTFTPTQSLTADILVVAGGGGGATSYAGGGGAGGLLAYTSQSLTATGYTVTVGAGGAKSTTTGVRGSNGANSQFASLTASVGGGAGGAAEGSSQKTGANGGSGGGGAGADGTQSYTGTNAGGTATSGQGFAGGTGQGINGQGSAGGGGGGAGAAGANASVSGSSVAGSGGNGSSAYSSWLSAIGLGQPVSGTYYIAGGGGGGAYSGTAAIGGYGGGANGTTSGVAIDATANTGGGGGGTGSGTASSGGSGIVIVRYAK